MKRALLATAALLAVGMVSSAHVTGNAAPLRGLTSAPQILRVYDAVFDARFNDVPTAMRAACGPDGDGGPAPPEACQVLEAVSLWWQIQIDPLSERLDSVFEGRVNAAVAATEAWTTREPERAEAWFYRGAAYGARVQWRVLRGQQLSAARDGKRIKDALERALALDPDMRDAWFGIGLYHYYADVAPTAAKMLRWLLFLPGGDRVQGLQEMLKARNGGALMRSEADYQLHILYLWYEKQPDRAIELLQDLEHRHPQNAHFPQLVAEIQDTYQHDPTASLQTWTALATRARARTVSQPDLAMGYARLGMGLQLDRLFETDKAIEQLRSLIDSHPTVPYGALALAQFRLGQALDRIGQRTEALSAYRAAQAANPSSDPLHITAQVRTGLRQGPSPQIAEAYRLSLAGWRALERGDTGEAARAIQQSLALRPDDPVTLYRQARLLQAQRNESQALAVYDQLSRAPMTTPPTIYASACVAAARLHEQRGTRDRAIQLYRIAASVFGADRQTKDDARRAIARLTGTK